MEITSVQVRVDGTLRPADPVEITVHLPEGDLHVQGWVSNSSFEAQWPPLGGQTHSTISWYRVRERDENGRIIPDDPEAF